MTFTSNETTWMATIATVGYTSAQLWVVTKITTAKDKEKAKEEIKNRFVLTFFAFCVLLSIFTLFTEFTCKLPLTRGDVVLMFFASYILFTSIIYAVLLVITKISSFQDWHLDYTDSIAETVEKIQIPMPNQKNAPAKRSR